MTDEQLKITIAEALHALSGGKFRLTIYTHLLRRLQRELAKVGLAIGPIPCVPTGRQYDSVEALMEGEGVARNPNRQQGNES